MKFCLLELVVRYSIKSNLTIEQVKEKLSKKFPLLGVNSYCVYYHWEADLETIGIDIKIYHYENTNINKHVKDIEKVIEEIEDNYE